MTIIVEQVLQISSWPPQGLSVLGLHWIRSEGEISGKKGQCISQTSATKAKRWGKGVKNSNTEWGSKWTGSTETLAGIYSPKVIQCFITSLYHDQIIFRIFKCTAKTFILLSRWGENIALEGRLPLFVFSQLNLPSGLLLSQNAFFEQLSPMCFYIKL